MKTVRLCAGRRRCEKPSRPRREPGAAYLAAGTNLLDLMKGGISRPEPAGRHQPSSRPRPHRGPCRRRRADRRAGPQRRSRARPRLSPGAFRRSPRRCCRARPRSFATPRPSAAICLQRTRCAYFYDVASACNKRDPGSGCDARGGDNRLHAIMGWSESCIATHPSDFCVPLVALDAVVEIEGSAGRREIPLEKFHRLPGETPERESVLEPGEMIVAVRLPAEAAHFAAPCPLPESSRPHLLCVCGRIGRGRSAHRG